MKLTDLDPNWVGAGGPGIYANEEMYRLGIHQPERHGVGLVFDCPCGCGERRYVPFNNPLDGGPRFNDTPAGRPFWDRTGETFETLTLTPSILASKDHGGCGWHGFITNGEVLTV